jgi:large subunit ribosomal protein L17
MLGNMASSLFRANAIVTTVPKARVVRSVAEKLITLGKRGDLHARRMAARRIKDRGILRRLFEEIAPQFADRQGGYTRLLKLGTRKGDGAQLARVELLMPVTTATPESDDQKGKSSKRRKKSEPAAAEAAG